MKLHLHATENHVMILVLLFLKTIHDCKIRHWDSSSGAESEIHMLKCLNPCCTDCFIN